MGERGAVLAHEMKRYLKALIIDFDRGDANGKITR